MWLKVFIYIFNFFLFYFFNLFIYFFPSLSDFTETKGGQYAWKCFAFILAWPPHIFSPCQKGWDDKLCLSLCVLSFWYVSVGGSRCQGRTLHRWQSLLCVYTLLSICVSIYLGVAWKTCSLLALCCFFSSSGTHTYTPAHTRMHIHTHTYMHTGCIFSWLGAWDILWTIEEKGEHCTVTILLLQCFLRQPCSAH